MNSGLTPAPAGAKSLVDIWHRVECLIAVTAFGFIAVVLILDVAGRELLAPIYRMFDIKGAAGVFAAQKMCVYALVVGSFCGVGIATPRIRLGAQGLRANDGPAG
jgi:hypothetical protein